ncbi:[FeFe] hydrogenase H-cluster radical SAM maturase HydG [Oceanispirochaeta sp.]|jgi:2-iminoacetate synthase|uniref:[FeFe] hydrogenase H-cluster radical SAM maturase HydG n=1 Tax=Oceanispirochaeta sp. TaxID=2035350 RepID=UPI00261432DA|nr:[FeFe] hydrogenase H-cluster radical SAM maturase HydG [Oceanispirochaeta sp.]MDA3958543.1 [FeFe] hydrogenase H-cluster radical SAM maturase HydG [Oceanispirochaeta sp.]
MSYPEFLNITELKELASRPAPAAVEVETILNKALKLKGLNTKEAAALLAVRDEKQIHRIMEAAAKAKETIYGKRMVMFAPLYSGNHCSNNCLYCGFRKDNKDITRRKLEQDEIALQTRMLLKEGHKRLLLLSGESGHYPLEYLKESLETIYKVEEKGTSIRRVNVEIAPLRVDEFKELKECNIGTYICFQETYDPDLYKKYHISGPKANYENRLYVMHRAMEAGIDDIGIGTLFGLADHRFEVLAMLRHAEELERLYNCGPHTVSVPRIEPAPGSALTENVPFPVDDDAFRTIIAVIRLSLPYTGIILSTRESAELRQELFRYGVSQISAGSKTSIGGYTEKEAENQQFALGDHRSMEEVINDMVGMGFIPSFCTGCYRKGRVGQDFMDLAKPGLIKHYCLPNGIVSFAEYLMDYAGDKTRKSGFALIKKLTDEESDPVVKGNITSSLEKINAGERDIYL